MGAGKESKYIKRDGGAANNCRHHRRSMTLPYNMQTSKVPEADAISIHVADVAMDNISIDTSVSSTAMDFVFEEDKDNGIWISATPSHISLSSTATTTLDQPLTLDTSVASCDTSIHSATSQTSDVYGWEEELDRKTSIEQHGLGNYVWERDLSSRLQTGSRQLSGGPRVRKGTRENEGKRKSLLYRVLNISGRKSQEDIMEMNSSVPQLPSLMMTGAGELSTSPVEISRHCQCERTST